MYTYYSVHTSKKGGVGSKAVRKQNEKKKVQLFDTSSGESYYNGQQNENKKSLFMLSKGCMQNFLSDATKGVAKEREKRTYMHAQCSRLHVTTSQF